MGERFEVAEDSVQTRLRHEQDTEIRSLPLKGGLAGVCGSIKWDFSKLLGVYVGFFALASVLFGRIVLQEKVPPSTWIGLGVIMAGCLVIQFGKR